VIVSVVARNVKMGKRVASLQPYYDATKQKLPEILEKGRKSYQVPLSQTLVLERD
jgi:hypothetical protein